jgi:two-component system chemotaxis response regulator CheY
VATFVIADDHEQPRDILRRILRDAGHEVVGIAHNGREAVALCAELRPDIVILDISMPVLTGTEAAAEILAAKSVGRVLIASSITMANIFGEMRSIGCAVIAKPYRPQQLVREIDAILSEGK